MNAPRPKPGESAKRDVKIATAISFFVTAGISLIFVMNASVSRARWNDIGNSSRPAPKAGIFESRFGTATRISGFAVLFRLRVDRQVMLRKSEAGRFPWAWRETGDFSDFAVIEPGQDGEQILLQRRLQPAAGLHCRQDRRHLRPGLGTADIQPVLPAQRPPAASGSPAGCSTILPPYSRNSGAVSATC